MVQMYFTKTPALLKPLAGDMTWEIKTQEKEVYLTFDDGPIPEVTPEVLNVLAEYDAKATFFCVGENIHRHPEVFQMVKSQGHAVGNHTFSHEKGWGSTQYSYLKSFAKCQQLTQTDLFRPPYGRIKRQQVGVLKNHVRIIMWDVLSGDFDPNCTVEKCVNNVLRSVKPGSIVVFHDSIKARKKVLGALPLVLKDLTEKGYKFRAL